MIELRRGMRLPTVAVLQSHLNQRLSSGEFVEADGIFGRLTEAAVERYRRQTHRIPSGRVDAFLWNDLVGSAWQVVDSVDRTDHDSRRHAINDHEDLAPYGQTILEQFGMSHGTPSVLSSVVASSRTGQVILLRFHGHGSSGNMVVASGRDGNAGSELNSRYGAGFDRALQQLRPIFSQFGSIEFHGCRVGSGAAGRKLLQRVAEATGVPATAALNSQYGGGQTTFRFEGPTHTCCPGGQTLKQWAQSTCQVSLAPGR